ncbi:sigma factor [Actinomadura opuntiae]|uniref:sigma factor n=1 Tax=Actinomadura sp. OS1-43 TaxID=604315 RepID=UPI00255ACA06|nr:sigma factor [Actinomadura sp. OS1-43]MDL4814165.1 sigma factor [Actinomadura sp. OS1-43]
MIQDDTQDIEPIAARPQAAESPPTPAELFTAHYGGMVRLARLLGADDPEDLAQEAFARLFRRRRNLRDPGSALA